MSDFMKKAEQFEDEHDAQVDQAVQRADQEADKRTSGKERETIDKAAEEVEQRD